MSWLALLLVGVACADLAHSVRPRAVANECLGAAVAVVLGLVAGLTDLLDLLALAVVAAVTVGWGLTVTRAFAGQRAWLPLTLFGTALVVAVVVSGAAGRGDGLLGPWLARSDLPWLHGLTPDRFLLLLGALLVQLSTGNVVVRLVLATTGTVNLSHLEHVEPEQRLKGGRMLGPTERIFILGLGLGGQLTAAAIVVAAKGLLRWPELQSAREQAHVHRLTEYFLVGSFVSWLLALTALVLLSTPTG